MLFYALLFKLTFGLLQVQGGVRAGLPAAWTAAAGRAGMLLPGGVMAPAALNGRQRLVMLDVNGAEALLLTTPSGVQVLLNGGASLSRLSDTLSRRLTLRERQLDWLVVSGVSNEQLDTLPATWARFPS